jgi:hypothetical protein
MHLFAKENATQIQRLFAVEQGKRLVFVYDCSAEAKTFGEEEALKGCVSRIIIAMEKFRI